jgi:hypothetical protein
MTQPAPDLKALFSEALEKAPGPERSAYLDGACRGDARLRTEIDAILDLYQRASGSLEAETDLEADLTSTGGAAATTSPAATILVPASAVTSRPFTEGPGSRVGPYLLLQKIGEGGMGAVYLAEQSQPIRRRVALKVIKPGMDTEQVVPASRPSARPWR